MAARVREQPAFENRYRPNGKNELRDAAAGENKVLPVHRWVPWIAGFSAGFVADAIDAYLPKRNRAKSKVLDPFAGVATTLVEALKAGCNVVGYEINPFAALAARAKINCVEVVPDALKTQIDTFRSAMERFESELDRKWSQGGKEAIDPVLDTLRDGGQAPFRSRIPFFSPPVEAKFLYALGQTSSLSEPCHTLFRIALGATMVSVSNYTYEPSLSSRPGAGKPLIENTSVALPTCRRLDEMLEDIGWAQAAYGRQWRQRERELIEGSYFDSTLPAGEVSLVVTSPPYMNNYHYVRNTRPQLHWLSLLRDGDGMRDLERGSYGKFWQTVRQGECLGLDFDFPELAGRIKELRGLNVGRGAYGGPGWANYVGAYFNDSNRFLGLLRRQLRTGAYAIVVVGNSIIQGMEFKVDELLAQMAEQHRLYVDEIRVVRTKRVGNSIVGSSVRNGGNAEAHPKVQLYDAAVVLRT